MIGSKREEREAQIATAAYALIAEKGYAGLTMTAVARRAKASNETLYNWYGDKIGLYRMLINRNTQWVVEVLDDMGGQTGQAGLQRIGEALLAMLLSPEAIALNRAAAADTSDSLGPVLRDAGRDRVLPLLKRWFEAHSVRLSLPPDQAAALWTDLLIGDLQIRCATAAITPPGAAQIAARAERAARMVMAMRA